MSLSIIAFGFGAVTQRHLIELARARPIHKITVVRASSQEEAISLPTTNSIKWCFLTTTSDLDWSEYDLMIIGSPASYHFEQTQIALMHDIPCLVEKPLTMTSAESRILVDKLTRESHPIVIGYDLTYTRGFSECNRLLQEIDVNDIWRVDIKVGQHLKQWRPQKDYHETVSARKRLGGGALRELSHELDYLLALFRPLKLSLQAQSIEHPMLPMDCENIVDIFGTLVIEASPITFSMHLNMLSDNPERLLKCYFSGGDITWDLIAQTITVSKLGTQPLVIDVSEPANMANIRMFEMLFHRIQTPEDSISDVIRAHNVMRLISEIETASAPKNTIKMR